MRSPENVLEGSIISPILANIYMNELDSYMAEYAEKFNCGNRRKINPAFKKKLDVCRGKEQRLKRNRFYGYGRAFIQL